MSNASSAELPRFGGSPLGEQASASESDFSGSESPLSLMALAAGSFFLLFGRVAWSSGSSANRFIAFSMDSMVELIWVMADKTLASTLSVPCGEEFTDSLSSDSLARPTATRQNGQALQRTHCSMTLLKTLSRTSKLTRKSLRNCMGDIVNKRWGSKLEEAKLKEKLAKYNRAESK